MIYIIQPFRYKHPLAKIIRQFLKERYPKTRLKIKRNYNSLKTNLTNTYFIINDPSLKSWDGLKISKEIRNKEPKALLILASTTVDYTQFFRSHIGFLGVINLENTNKSEIENYLEDSIKLTSIDI